MLSRTTRSTDGVAISYSVSGAADTALVLIHGGLADRSFWDGQHEPFADRFRVIAPDLAGHGESGRNREKWGIAEFAHDVLAAIDAERVSRAVFVGNSLGGVVAIEAALLAGTRATGVIGVDTFQDLSRRIDPQWANEQADAWGRDFAGTLDRMLGALFHPDAAPSLVAGVRRRMARTPGEVVAAMFRSFAGYDTGASARQLRVPVRCINGDLWATDTQANREVVADFDAVILPHTGHFPMLERPDEFNRRLAELVLPPKS
ncbi:MAG: alpha/beta hydrolase [Acidobacteriia bacterium]|nr:alpha/beta hydrolase [Terriglobia bacterium]